MPYDSNGNYTLPTIYQAKPATTIRTEQHNTPFEDVQAALNQVLLRNGATPVTANWNMASNRIINLADGTAATDAATVGQLSKYLALSTTSLQTVSGSVNFAGTLKLAYGIPFSGGTSTGSSRWVPLFTAGNPSKSANNAFSFGFQIFDIVGDPDNDLSGINMLGFDYAGVRYDAYFSWKGNITTPKGKVAFVSDVSAETSRAETAENNLQNAIDAESTRASTVESNLQSGKISRNGDDAINGSFNVANTLTVGTSFSWTASTGYGFFYRRTTALTGAFDWYSDYGAIKASILRLLTDGTLNILGAGTFQVRGDDVALAKNIPTDYVTGTTYNSDFSTSDGRVVNMAYGHRCQTFTVSAASGTRVNFPTGFSGAPTSIQITPEDHTDTWYTDKDSGGFTIWNANNVTRVFSITAWGPK
ncbi:hypothetical protein AD947_07320 [Acetobacter tropicalis]|uniref:Tail fiber protein n=1 Tax=Acetobacter tropicalis TaxID=104102 RepID=A0A149TXV9_9PROT|nr:hypothetical protein [Acetobacter tropicalis]KXV57991.1 hypothetical protein AD947_07320 [Acetobacter tropicalis]